MPNVITHGLMANEVVQLLEKSDVALAIETYPQLFFFGSNGPDYLFYYRYFSLDEDAKSMRQLGNLFHDEYINEFYTAAKNHLNRLENDQDKQMALSYIAGHLCHWALDSLAHPYVFHKTGLIEGDTRYDHYRFEAMIDTLVVKRVQNKKFMDVPSYKFVKLNAKEKVSVAKVYQAITFEVLGKRVELKKFVDAMSMTYNFNLLLFDKIGLRSRLIRPIEKYILKDEWVFTSHLVTPDVDIKNDILNLRRDEWSHPCDSEMKSTASFMDLFHQSTIRAYQALNALTKDLAHGTNSLEEFIDGRNYSTGLSEPCDMINFDIIYKH